MCGETEEQPGKSSSGSWFERSTWVVLKIMGPFWVYIYIYELYGGTFYCGGYYNMTLNLGTTHTWKATLPPALPSARVTGDCQSSYTQTCAIPPPIPTKFKTVTYRLSVYHAGRRAPPSMRGYVPTLQTGRWTLF